MLGLGYRVAKPFNETSMEPLRPLPLRSIACEADSVERTYRVVAYLSHTVGPHHTSEVPKWVCPLQHLSIFDMLYTMYLQRVHPVERVVDNKTTREIGTVTDWTGPVDLLQGSHPSVSNGYLDPGLSCRSTTRLDAYCVHTKGMSITWYTVARILNLTASGSMFL